MTLAVQSSSEELTKFRSFLKAWVSCVWEQRNNTNKTSMVVDGTARNFLPSLHCRCVIFLQDICPWSRGPNGFIEIKRGPICFELQQGWLPQNIKFWELTIGVKRCERVCTSILNRCTPQAHETAGLLAPLMRGTGVSFYLVGQLKTLMLASCW